MDTKKLSSFGSLRSRYLFATLFVALIVFSALYLSHFIVQGSRDLVSQNISNRSEVLQLSREIRESLLTAYSSMDAFLLEPQKTEAADVVSGSLQKASQYVQELLNHPWVKESATDIHLERMPRYLADLRDSINILVEIRKDPLQQFPSLALSNKEMRPYRNQFNSAMAVAVEELNNTRQNGEAINESVYQTLITTRHYWEQMVSNYRLYIANRLGSFSEKSLSTQEDGINTLYATLQEKLSELTNLDEQSLLGFEESNALPVLIESSTAWYRAYEGVVEIHHAGVWRTDKSVLTNAIEPQMNFVWDLLHTFEHLVEDTATKDIKSISAAAVNQEKLLWGITLLTISMLLVSFVYSNSAIFEPISRVTTALREEAAGREGIVIPKASSRETETLIEAFVDMKKLIRNRQLALEHKSLHDDLTGLPNRTLLFDRIAQSLTVAARSSSSLAVLIIGIENLKEIYDSHGHDYGDQLILSLSNRLEQWRVETDTLARLGEQEFALVCADVSLESALDQAATLYNNISQLIKVKDRELYPELRIGIALFPEQGDSAHTLLQKASYALQQAGLQQRSISSYNENFDRNNQSVFQPSLIAELKYAVKHHLLEMHYQPKVLIANQKVVGVEALLRWRNLDYGWIQTSEIVAMVEKSGLINQLTEWTIQEAIQQYVIWRSVGINLQVAINLSVYALQDEAICSFIQKKLTNYDVDPDQITLEVTESAMMTNPKKVSSILHKLSALGVKISADDFGTGFSSLTHLKKLPVNEIKIDKSFVTDVESNAKDKAIVKSAIGLARDLGISVVAEGIEKQQTLDKLNELDCDVGQGYLFSKPLSAKALTKWLKTQSSDQFA